MDVALTAFLEPVVSFPAGVRLLFQAIFIRQLQLVVMNREFCEKIRNLLQDCINMFRILEINDRIQENVYLFFRYVELIKCKLCRHFIFLGLLSKKSVTENCLRGRWGEIDE
ncbi:hypothetical protein A6K76_10185 [Caryophanon latum]|uniref:Uncharacterized protein n=1 Tax=Caryophanon latum TaxID=33977 RepID=A0A1C0YVB8_9BACL|nr:hypothetical protein A6K76_10185 [Caryophanon latum]